MCIRNNVHSPLSRVNPNLTTIINTCNCPIHQIKLSSNVSVTPQFTKLIAHQIYCIYDMYVVTLINVRLHNNNFLIKH